MITAEDSKYLKSQSKLLKSIMYPEDIPNKCTDCEERRLIIDVKKQVITGSYCPYCPNDCEELGNNAEEIPNYPDDDSFDDFHSSRQCHEWQIGEREL